MRILVLQNLRAGGSDAGVYDYMNALGRKGSEVVMRFLGPESSAEELLSDAERFDRVVAVGGDGTVSTVAYALRNRSVPLLAYPAGTANLLAQNLRMPANPAALARTTLSGPVVRVDLGEIVTPHAPGNGATGFVVMAGAGFDARIMEGAQAMKAALGVGAYLMAALQNLTPTVSEISLDLDGKSVTTEGIAVLLVNFARIQFDLAVTHDSDAQDGLFEVVVMRTKNAMGLLPAIWGALLDRVAGDHPDRSPSFEIHTASSIRIEATPSMPVQYDGETLGENTPLAAHVLPGACSLVVPEGTADDSGHLFKSA